MPGDPVDAEAELERHDQHPDRSVHLAGAAGICPQQQRSRVCRTGGSGLDRGCLREDSIHRAGKPMGARLCRKLQCRFRDELLNLEIFYSPKEAQIIIEGWRKLCNTKRQLTVRKRAFTRHQSRSTLFELPTSDGQGCINVLKSNLRFYPSDGISAKPFLVGALVAPARPENPAGRVATGAATCGGKAEKMEACRRRPVGCLHLWKRVKDPQRTGT